MTTEPPRATTTVKSGQCHMRKMFSFSLHYCYYVPQYILCCLRSSSLSAHKSYRCNSVLGNINPTAWVHADLHYVFME